MKTVKLTDAQLECLTGLLNRRIKVQKGLMTPPEQFKRNMWPIQVDAEAIKANREDYKKRQKWVTEFEGIIKKLEKAK